MTKTNFDNTVSSLSNKSTANKKINESIENLLKKLPTLDLSYFIGKSYFEEDGTQNYLVFQPIHIYFKITNTKYISSWKSKGLYEETVTPYTASDNSLTALIDHYGSKVRVTFNGSCLKQPNKLTYSYEAKVNVLFISLVLLVLTVVILH